LHERLSEQEKEMALYKEALDEIERTTQEYKTQSIAQQALAKDR
jgi:hypothetical protein